MLPSTPPSSPQVPFSPILVWWVLWIAMVNGLILQRVFLSGGFQTGDDGLGFLALVPLAVSAGIRFAVLPRMKTKQKALPLFLAGLATAEACGLIGILLGGAHRDSLFVTGLVMMLLYIPLFVRNYDGGGNSSPFRS